VKCPRSGPTGLREEKENRAFIDKVPDAFNFRLLGEQVVRERATYVSKLHPIWAFALVPSTARCSRRCAAIMGR
jgi:hypothetical protein